MEFAIQLNGRDADAEMRLLLQWLRQEHIPSVKLQLSRPEMAEEKMGAMADAIQIIGPDGAAAAVATAISAWIATRRKELKVRVRRADGSEVEVEQRGGSGHDEILRAVMDTDAQ